MIDASKLPTVPSEIAPLVDKATEPTRPESYARAPEATGPQSAGIRPPAVHWSAR